MTITDMESRGNSSLFDGPSPQGTPPPPLALHEFLGQDAPSPFAYPSSSASTPVDAPFPSSHDPAAVEGDSPIHTPASELPQRRPDTEEEETEEISKPQVPANPDWLSIRSQVRPGKDMAKKAEWIQGWSEAVGAYGGETYCACSDTEASRTSALSLAVSGMGIKQRRKQPLIQGDDNGCQEAGETANGHQNSNVLCKNCSRPPSPPLRQVSSPPGDLAEERHSRHIRRLRSRVSGFFKRVMSGRGLRSHDQSLDFGPASTSRNGIVPFSSPSKPDDSNVGALGHPSDAVEELVDPDDLSSSNDGQRPRADNSLAARNARLERAKRQLQKMNSSGAHENG